MVANDLASCVARASAATVLTYRQVSNIRRTLVGNKIVDYSDVVGASPEGAAPTTSSFSTQYLASLDWAKTRGKTRRETVMLGDLVRLILEILR